jgi:hypothetical protein
MRKRKETSGQATSAAATSDAGALMNERRSQHAGYRETEHDQNCCQVARF